jgi:orotidine-5'-phosphate decarboxylase
MSSAAQPNRPRAAPGAARAFAAFCASLARRIDEDSCFQVAAALTFTTLLSLVPLFAVVLSVSTAFPAFQQWIETLQHFVMRNFLPDTGQRLIDTQLSKFAGNAAQLTAIGLVFLGVTALSLMFTVDETFHRLFRIANRRPLVRRLMLYLGVLIVVPLLLGASVSITSWIVGYSLGYLGGPRWLSIAVLRLVPYVFTCIAFTLLYHVLPGRQVALRHAFAGGLIAALAFELAKQGFAMYLGYFPTYTMIYGAFAVIPIFLLWVYISWLVVVIGATITAILPQYDHAKAGANPGMNSGTIALAAVPPPLPGDRPMNANPATAPDGAAVDRRERLIVALDVPTAADARALVEKLGDSVHFYKIGLELFTSGGYFELLAWLAARDKKVFADLKFYDIPETVRRAVSNLKDSGATFVTVHGHRSVMEAAVSANSGVRILAVTVLTSFDKRDLAEMGANADVGQLVLSRARGAVECGCDGVISSGLEAPQIKAAFGNRLTVVTPGIRPLSAGEKPSDDQKRTVDVAQAFANGADYIVVGRPVRDAADPKAAAESIQATIAAAFPAG